VVRYPARRTLTSPKLGLMVKCPDDLLRKEGRYGIPELGLGGCSTADQFEVIRVGEEPLDFTDP